MSNMGLSTIDRLALLVLGASAPVGTFGKRLMRIISFAVMLFAIAGLALSLSHYWRAPSQGPITDNAPSFKSDDTKNADGTTNTNKQIADTNILNITGPHRLLFDATIGDQLASKLPTGKSIEIIAVGARADWNIANQYAQYLKAKGLDVSLTRSSETVPGSDRKISIRDDPTTPPIIVILAPSAL